VTDIEWQLCCELFAISEAAFVKTVR